jgi:hypothetical protein
MNRHLRPTGRTLRAIIIAGLLAAQLPTAGATLAQPTGVFTAKLSGTHEIPPVATSASGTARIILSGPQIDYQLLVNGLGTITSAEIDLGAIGSNGRALFQLTVNGGEILGTLTASDLAPGGGISFDAALDAIASGGTYVNVRTAASPAGELRGQIAPVTEPASYTISAGAPPTGTPPRDDILPRTLTVASGSVVHLLVFGQHTATLLPAGIQADQDTTDPTLNAPQGCGTAANPCLFDGSAPISIGPASDPGGTAATVVILAPVGSYVIHSRLQPAMVGLLQVVPSGTFEISSIDDIALAIAAQLGATPPPATSIYSNLRGYDISYPDCRPERLSSIPAAIADGFAIVGVNGGRMFRYNPCLSTLWNWAGGFALRSLYINMNAAAGPTKRQGRTGPAGPCASSDRLCYGYNYGYNGARAAWRYAYHQLGPAALPAVWWLDVEVDNVWYTPPDLGANAAVIQGALAFLGTPGRYGAPAMGYMVGIYSTRFQFKQIAGSSFRPQVPVWYATVEKGPSATRSRCDPESWSFTGGPIWLVQYLPSRIDGNTGCP